MFTRTAITGLGLLMMLAAMTGMVFADKQDWQAAEKVEVQLGDEAGALVFIPARLELEADRMYRLVLTNPSPERHYFESQKFSDSVKTRKVLVRDSGGNKVAEVKGLISKFEVYPEATVEWWLTTVERGTFEFTDLKCGIPGHAEAGMVGEIIIR